MKPIDVYTYYANLYRYFRAGSEPYDESAFKEVSAEHFKMNPERDRWEKLAKKKDIKNYILANILMDNYKIKDFTDAAYTKWCAANESLSYRFKEDMEMFFIKGPTLNVTKLYLDYKMSFESIIIMCNLADTNPIKSWMEDKDSHISYFGFKLFKYEPIVLQRINLDKFRKILQEVLPETTR